MKHHNPKPDIVFKISNLRMSHYSVQIVGGKLRNFNCINRTDFTEEKKAGAEDYGIFKSKWDFIRRFYQECASL